MRIYSKDDKGREKDEKWFQMNQVTVKIRHDNDDYATTRTKWEMLPPLAYETRENHIVLCFALNRIPS